MRLLKLFLAGALFLVLSLGFGWLANLTGHAADKDLTADKSEPVHGFAIANLDKSCKPCEDFYKFAVGGWMANNPVPAAYPSWGRFNVLNDENQETLHQILESTRNTTAPAGSNEKKISDFYCSCMDADKIEAEGIKPMDAQLKRIAEIKDLNGLQAVITDLQAHGVNVAFRFSSSQDFKNSSQVIGEADQGGLGLPDRDYYSKDDDRSKMIREEYVKHMTKMFELLGDSGEKAAQAANAIMALETKLAQAQLTRVQRRNPAANYHMMDLDQLKELTSNFSWPTYFKAVGATSIASINVGQPDFFKELNKQLGETAIADWRDYLRWHLINATADQLSSQFVDEDFHFKGSILTGAKEILPRWKRCARATDEALGEALGQLYVAKVFTPQAKAHALEMVHNLQSALRSDLETLSWMGPATRKEAITKLDAIVNKIGYPDKWRDYSGLQIERGSYALNTLKSGKFDFQFDLGKIGKSVDRGEWGMTPPTVNAYYSPTMNEIVFPAGILQPPFFDPKADDAVNYGAIGTVIGHELTHGFDDQGRQFDAQGNLRDWWSAEDLKNFQERAACVEKQFDNFTTVQGQHLTGKLVLGESIADLGGITIAWAAYQKSLEGKPHPQDIDGFTAEQRFFLGYAQVWATNARPEYETLMANTNPHPLPRYRVNGPLSNLSMFAKAFGCKQGDAMVRADGCRIW